MSHVAEGFCVTDIDALRETIKSQCPDLELVEQKEYRTWISDNGRLVGDYPLPGFYQVKLMGALVKQGIDVHAIAKKQGVTLPANLLELEKNPFTLADQRKLCENPTIAAAYESLAKNVIGKDAKYVIRMKGGDKRAYEIGLVPHPVRKGEYQMITDFYNQGNGLLNARGVGQHQNKGGRDVWGADLKKAYAIRAAEKTAEAQVKALRQQGVNARVTKTTLPDGRVQIQLEEI